MNTQETTIKILTKPDILFVILTNSDFEHQFDIAVWTDPMELTGISANRIYKSLKYNGVFIYEMCNDITINTIMITNTMTVALGHRKMEFIT